jgi:hypothetical protein
MGKAVFFNGEFYGNRFANRILCGAARLTHRSR